MSNRVLRPFAVVLFLSLWAESSRALPLEVALHPDSSAAPTAPIKITLTPTSPKAGTSPQVKETTVGEGTAFDLPAGSNWTLSIAAEGLYASPRVVVMSSAPQQVEIDLLPAGTIQGEVRMPKGEPLPKELTVRFRGVPEAARPLAEATVVCPLADGKLRCVLPAGDLDLRFRTRGFVTLYRWNAKVVTRRSLALGAFDFKPGSSVVGWIEPPARDFRFSECSVELSPQTPGTGTTLGDVSRRESLAQTTRVGPHGLFELSGVPPGSYRVTIKHPKYAPAHFGPIQVYAGRETEIQSIRLEPAVDFTVHLDPPIDPYGHNWSVALYQSDQSPHGFVPIKDSAASPAGAWRGEGLEPGRYLLTVKGSYRSEWSSEALDIGPGMPPHEIELPVVRVSGAVSLGKEPLAALLWFGGQHGVRKIPAKSDSKGNYEVVLPRQKESWPVEIVNEPEHIEGLVREVSIPTDRASATADLGIPDTRISGLVVEEDDHAVAEARVEGIRETAHEMPISTHSSDPDGRFELRGIAAGAWRLEAAANGLKAESTLVQVAEGSPATDLKLVLRRVRKVSGQVVDPSGTGIPGAQIIAVLDQGPTILTADIPSASTDVNGSFELKLPAHASGVSLTVFPPGFAIRQVRVDAENAQPLVVPVEQVGGTLRVHYSGTEPLAGKRRHFTSFFHESQLAYPDYLEEWAVENGAMQTADDLFVVPMLEPGPYTVCYAIGGLVGRSGKLPPGGGGSRCAQGTLPPFGDLTLDLTAPREVDPPGKSTSP